MKLLVMVVLLTTMVGCSTVSGLGKDISGAAEWSKDKMGGGQKL